MKEGDVICLSYECGKYASVAGNKIVGFVFNQPFPQLKIIALWRIKTI